MSANTEPLVSVVTPFHNTEPYLVECIESVFAQTYQNWEYILVNNCSTDKSSEIAYQYAKKDQRIRLIHTGRFLTQVENYNYALRQISPESMYCKIVQADDWIFPECISRMATVAETHPSIGLVSSYRLDDSRINCLGLPKNREVFDGREICKGTLSGGPFVFGSSTTVLFRSRLVRERTPFFSETSLHEDTEVCYEILERHDFGFVHQVLSFSRRENESMSTPVREFNPNLLDFFIVLSKYGKVYLEEQEYRRRLNEVRYSYYDFLADNLKACRGRGFWEYHRRGLATIGAKLSFSEIAGFLLKRKVKSMVRSHRDTAIRIFKRPLG